MRKFLVLALMLVSPFSWGADTAISVLPAASSVGATDIAPFSQGATTRKVTALQLATYEAAETLTLTNKSISGASNTLSAIANASLTNSAVTLNGASLSLGGTRTLGLASADFVNQGTTTTLLHGNAAGNPSFGAVSLTADVTGTLPVANGGTGQTALSALTANPSAVVGSAAVNGSASTFMRSDAAPAIDLTAAYTWTGVHTYSSTAPRNIFSDTSQGTDLKNFDFFLDAGVFTGRTRTDADGAGFNWLAVTRGALATISNISLGNATNNPTYTFNGSGTVSTGGSISIGGGSNIFSGRVTLSANGSVSSGNEALIFASSAPAMELQKTNAGANAKIWASDASVANTYAFYLLDDARGSLTNALLFTRSGAALTSLDIGNTTNNPVTNFLGTGATTHNGQVVIAVGKGLTVTEGSNAKMGTCTLVAGVCTISTTAVTANSRIFCTAQSLGTVTVGQGIAVSARTAGTSYAVTSGSAIDTSVVACMIVEPS